MCSLVKVVLKSLPICFFFFKLELNGLPLDMYCHAKEVSLPSESFYREHMQSPRRQLVQHLPGDDNSG